MTDENPFPVHTLSISLPITDSLLEDIEGFRRAQGETPPVLPMVTREEAEQQVRDTYFGTAPRGMSCAQALEIVREMHEANIEMLTRNRLAHCYPAQPIVGDDPLDQLSRAIGCTWRERSQPLPYPAPHIGSFDGTHFWAAYDDDDGVAQTFDSRPEWEQRRDAR